MANNTLPGKLRFTQGGVVFGDSIACDTILPEGWIAVNTDNDTISIHDGIIKGGITPSYQVSGFSLLYVGGNPSTSELVINSSASQRVALPTNSGTVRLTFFGYGPFRYRLGNGTVVALSTDAPAASGFQIVVPVETFTHIAVYGFASGSLVIEGGWGGI